MCGTRKDEGALHRTFSLRRKQGEWFRIGGALRDLMDEHALPETVYFTGSEIEPPRYRSLLP